MTKKIYISFLILLSVYGCEKKVDWDIKEEQTDMIIVDGMLTDETKAHEIKLTFPVTELNKEAEPVTGATVILSDNDSSWTLTEQPDSSGIYVTKSNFAGESGKEYTLLINYKGSVLTAREQMPQSSQFVSLIHYEKNTQDSLYHFTKVANIYNAHQAAMWEVLLDWSNAPGYTDSLPENCRATLYYYTLSTIDVSEVLAPQLDKVEFPAYTIITQRKYSLTPEFEEYLRALLMETTWQGGLFNTASANLPTNVSNGGAGYFATCPVSWVSMTVTP